MVIGQSDKGRESARGLMKSVAAEQRKIEAAKGSALAKGMKRIEERAGKAAGKSAGAEPKS